MVTHKRIDANGAEQLIVTLYLALCDAALCATSTCRVGKYQAIQRDS